MSSEQLDGDLDRRLLAVLRGKPAHGYAIVTGLYDQGDGRFDLPEGVVYPALHRLEGAGMLRSYWAGIAGRRRRIYEITGQGVAALTDQRQTGLNMATAIGPILGRPA